MISREQAAVELSFLRDTNAEQVMRIAEQSKRITELELDFGKEQRKYNEEWNAGERLGKQVQDLNNEVYVQEKRAETAEAKLAEIVPILEQAQEQISEEDDVAIAMEAERDELREALDDYGQHAPECMMRQYGYPATKCNCDWEKTKAALAKGDKKC